MNPLSYLAVIVYIFPTVYINKISTDYTDKGFYYQDVVFRVGNEYKIIPELKHVVYVKDSAGEEITSYDSTGYINYCPNIDMGFFRLHDSFPIAIKEQWNKIPAMNTQQVISELEGFGVASIGYK